MKNEKIKYEKKIMSEITKIKKNKEIYKKVTQRLLRYLNDVEDDLINAKGNEIRFRMHGFSFGTGTHYSYQLTVNEHFIPDKVERMRWDYYPLGDFNNYAQWMTREEVLDLANNLQEFVKKVSAEIERIKSESEKAVATIPS